MFISKLVGERKKENPSDATIKSHSLLMRAGYIKSVANGIFSLGMPAKRVAKKIENIIREEMDLIEGQECMFPVVMPRELWEESGRYSTIADELVRFKDRSDRDMVLGMTHEEAAVHFARDFVNSYNQLPCMIYQIQTKFRDEARSRGGLIRVREFTMKDAYSFHISQEDLELYYERVYNAYNRIFQRMGMRNFIAVASDTGMMGGKIAHEFMLLTPIGEDTIAICEHCGYKANMEVAEYISESFRDEVSQNVEEVFTAEAKDIEEVSNFLNLPKNKTAKAVSFNVKGEETLVLCFIRGDLEVNEAKLKRIIGKDIAPSNLKDSQQLVAGNIGFLNLNLKDAIIVYDKSIKDANNLVIGANKPLYHIKGVDIKRDTNIKDFYDIAKIVDGSPCPQCGKAIKLSNGIEIGNIFQLGTKYTQSMEMKVLNKEGRTINPIMGCYGIGVGRAISSVLEENNDERGMIWPMAIAPWQVYLCPLRLDKEEVREKTYELYETLKKNQIEVLFDDRDVSAGYKFSDCDLMGIPIRMIVSQKSLLNGEVEIQLRDGSYKENIKLENCIDTIKEIIKKNIEG